MIQMFALYSESLICGYQAELRKLSPDRAEELREPPVIFQQLLAKINRWANSNRPEQSVVITPLRKPSRPRSVTTTPAKDRAETPPSDPRRARVTPKPENTSSIFDLPKLQIVPADEDLGLNPLNLSDSSDDALQLQVSEQEEKELAVSVNNNKAREILSNQFSKQVSKVRIAERMNKQGEDVSGYNRRAEQLPLPCASCKKVGGHKSQCPKHPRARLG